MCLYLNLIVSQNTKDMVELDPLLVICEIISFCTWVFPINWEDLIDRVAFCMHPINSRFFGQYYFSCICKQQKALFIQIKDSLKNTGFWIYLHVASKNIFHLSVLQDSVISPSLDISFILGIKLKLLLANFLLYFDNIMSLFVF